MELTKEQLRQIIPKNPYLDHWFDVLSQLLPDYDINTPQRIASFLAQCTHESNDFTALKENLNYRAASLRKLFPTHFETDEIANHYANLPNKQEAIANRLYCNRMGNGDEASGDGYRYCGRGGIQITGKDNYFWFAASISITPEEASEYMQTFEGALQSACWFWENNNLNKWADAGDDDKMTRIINGGTIGIEDRKARKARILRILGA
jgi:putative chitinase